MDLMVVLPIIVVAVTGMLALIAEMLQPKRNNGLIVAISLVGLVFAGIVLASNFGIDRDPTFGGMFVVDRFGSLIQFIVIVGTGLAIVFSEGYLREKRIPFGEFYPLMLWSSVGAMIMATTRNLLVIFLGLEILSVALYVMAGLSRGEEKSNESALKYFLLGAFASGFLLYGIAFIYGATNGLEIGGIRTIWVYADATTRTMVVLGMGLIIVGLGFKTSLVPFHQWTPDVYQGAPTNVASFMATVSKAGAFAALVRLLDGCLIFSSVWLPPLAVIALLTMTVGNLAALTQKDVKRMLGYSSVAQAGYVLVAILAHEKTKGAIDTGTVAYYLFGYTAMTAGAFAVVSTCARNGKEGTRLEDLNGLWKRSPFATLALIVFLASLIGIPPTVGFVGKFQIFSDAMNSGLTWLAIALAINSVISAYYYLRIGLAAIATDETEAVDLKPIRFSPGVAGTCLLSLVGVIGAILPPVFQLITQR
jgi:NADH-quinone oxidoreductase subunit N